MESPVFLITPPFTQLNTPYPATAYLKGFLNTKGIPSVQADLGIEVTLAASNKAGLTNLFDKIESQEFELNSNAQRILALKNNKADGIKGVGKRKSRTKNQYKIRKSNLNNHDTNSNINNADESEINEQNSDESQPEINAKVRYT